MLILCTLLSAFIVGFGCFLFEEFYHQPAMTGIAGLSVRYPSRSQITGELDNLLNFYQQGLITEEQYLSSADKLIDQLVIALHSESASLSSASLMDKYADATLLASLTSAEIPVSS